MRMLWRRAVIVAGIAGVGVVSTQAQVELDRIVKRVGARVITKSDLRQATLLKLVDDVSSEEAVQRGLEDRWLILDEISRAVALPPSSEQELTAHRASWEQRVGGAAAVPGLLAKSGMSDASLQAWLRDDLRIQAYLNQQFGKVPPGDRPRLTSDWLSRLRQRAGVKRH